MLVLRRNACVYALREKETFFSCKEDLHFSLYDNPPRWDPDYPPLPHNEDFFIENFETDPVIEADQKVQSAEEELAIDKKLSLWPISGIISLGGKSFGAKQLRRREVGVQATTREVCSLLPFALLAFWTFQAFFKYMHLASVLSFRCALLVKPCPFPCSAGCS